MSLNVETYPRRSSSSSESEFVCLLPPGFALTGFATRWGTKPTWKFTFIYFLVFCGQIPDSIRSSPFWRHSVWGYFHQDLPPLASSRLQHLALAWSRHVTNWNRLDALIYVFQNISDNALWIFSFSAIVQLSITFWWQLSFSSNFTWLGPLLWALAVYSWATKRNIIFPSELWRDSNLRQESKQARAGFTRLDSHGGKGWRLCMFVNRDRVGQWLFCQYLISLHFYHSIS